MYKSKSLVILVFALLVWTQNGLAGGKLFARFPNRENSPVFHLHLKKFKANVEIQDQLAVVHLDETFFNDRDQTLEGIYFLTLPEGSKVTGMALWINGERLEHEIKPREEAVQEYEEIVRRSIDPLLAEEVGENEFRLRLFPLPPLQERRIEITYVQPLPLRQDAVEFLLPLVLTDYDAGETDSARVTIDLQTQHPIASVTPGAQVPEQTTTIERIDGSHYRVSFAQTNKIFEFDFSFSYSLTQAQVFSSLAYQPDKAAEDGFFLLWARPPDDFFPETETPRQVALCVDISASMIGDKLTQVKQALVAILSELRPHDRFSVVTFNTSVNTFSDTLLPADSLNLAQATSFIQTLSATGLTNMNAALLETLAMFATTEGPAQILLISDGEPTAGETSTDQILSNVSAHNTAGVDIFPVGIGSETNRSFFEALAQQNGGRAFFIDRTDELRQQLTHIFRQVSAPLLTSVEIVHGGVTTYDVLPQTLPNLARGSQASQTGRFLPPGAGSITLHGDNGAEIVEHSASIDWRQAPQKEAVSRLWAAHKIAALQEEIDLLGEAPELVDAIVLLSTTYSVLSRYTAFLVVEPGGSPVTSVDAPAETVPEKFTLYANYPNPFNPETTIRFVVPANSNCTSCAVRLEIYNVLGELIRVLVDESLAPGEHSVTWDGTDRFGSEVASGVYIYKLRYGDKVAARRMLLLR